MPTYLLRVAPDDPTYVAWSTVVEAPTFMGDETAALEYLKYERTCSQPCCHKVQVLDRLERANRFGTSSLDGYMGYDDDGFIVEQRGVLPRSALGPFTRAYMRDDADEWMTYLQPFDDELSAVRSA